MLSAAMFVRLFFPYSAGFEFIWFDALGLLFIAAFFDLERPWCLRNLDVVMIAAWVPLGEYEKGYYPFTTLYAYLLLFYFLARLLLHGRCSREQVLSINFGPRTLLLLTVLLSGYSTVLTFLYPFPYDLGREASGISNSAAGGMAGARCLLEGKIVYGNVDILQPDSSRKSGWDCYGPAHYYTYVPFEWAFPTVQNFRFGYGFAARLLTCSVHILSMLCLYILGTRVRGNHFGLALAFAWAVLPYGFLATYCSKSGDFLPGALTILALALFQRSYLLGAIGLAYCASAAFFPVLYIPVWAASLPRNRRRAFVLLTCTVGLALTVPMLRQPNGIGIFLQSTFGFLESFGDWPWSVWTQYPSMKFLRAFLVVMLFPFVCLVTRLARGADFRGVLAFTGAVAIYFQLEKLYAPGRYYLWFLPFLLLYLLDGQPIALVPDSYPTVPSSARSAVRP